MTDKLELRRLANLFHTTKMVSSDGAELLRRWVDAVSPANVVEILDELEACKLLLQQCDQVIQEDGGVYIELRAFLGGKLPASEVIALLGPDGKDG